MAEIRVHHPHELNGEEWRQLQTIEREAFMDSLDRSQDEVDALVGWDDPERFVDSHLDPNTEVGRRLYSNQELTRPKVAVAYENGTKIGFAYGANNVSGSSEKLRFLKRFSILKNYLWIKEVVVSPEHQRRGVARALGRALLKDSITLNPLTALRPVTAYTWPDEPPGVMQGVLKKLGFKSTGEKPAKVFGENSAEIRQERLKARTVIGLLWKTRKRK